MSTFGKAAPAVQPPPEWADLAQLADEAVRDLRMWRERAQRAEAEAVSLRAALEQVDTAAGVGGGSGPSAAQFKAENQALRSRMAEANHRVTLLLGRLDAMEARR